ncbi:glutamate 5-kinase [Roseiconus lacunae]|uniref:Glutamate 5-kinase n=1 Tax=Roseiconus lacunae TaxID=2605694 RepID=A0ABT7PLN2_9BACT|nr:glutamate 5-kinase [Roseiconus lacunae]MDM4017407.1 glutamate 5-kinase [Roseiconus lacunae]
MADLSGKDYFDWEVNHCQSCHNHPRLQNANNVPLDSSAERQKAIESAGSVVVKVGTRVLTDSSGKLDRHRIECLSRGLCKIADTGRQTIIVSSGAVGAGMGKLGLSQRPTDLGHLQAVAAIGQADLIQSYEASLAESGRHAAQVLLTRNDLQSREGYLNVRNALSQIHELGAIAVVNENDSVAVAELMTTFGDNDRLAAQVAGLLDQCLLVILSDIDGLYDGSPDHPESQRINIVETLDDDVMSMASDKRSSLSKGGMSSKLAAAQLATSHGHAVIIGPGRDDLALEKVLQGEMIGTLFLPCERTLRGRRRWISASAEVEGRLIIDDGAVKAIHNDGSSLLAIGITGVVGEFDAGAVVMITDRHGYEIARGLCNYPSSEVDKIKGKISEMIGGILGHRPYESVVHRDNLSLHMGADRTL